MQLIMALMDDGFPYRVKFKDIRVKPPKRDTSRARAAKTRVCDHDSCDLAGEHPAPRENGRGQYWFCQHHAADYNRNFNFFDTMTEAELAAFEESARYGHKRTWQFGTGPMGGSRAAFAHDRRKWRGSDLFEDNATGPASEAPGPRGRTRLQVRALRELDLTETATSEEIRARYAKRPRSARMASPTRPGNHAGHAHWPLQ